MAVDFLFARSSSICTRRSARPRSIASSLSRRESDASIRSISLTIRFSRWSAAMLPALDFFRQRLDEFFQTLRRRELALGAFRQHAGERVDAACEIIEFGLGTRPDGETIDLFGERLYLR